MRRKLLLIIWCVISVYVIAQNDPVIARINGDEIIRSEFEHYYLQAGKAGQTPSDILEAYLTLKLMASHAKNLSLDTIISLKNQLNIYRRQKSLAYLSISPSIETLALQMYERMKEEDRNGQLLVLCLFKELPQNISSYELYRTEQWMDSIYRTIHNADENEFREVVDKFSDDKNMRWINRLQVSEEFEKGLYGLSKGQVSRPFTTPKGMGIARIMGSRSAPDYEDVKDGIMRRLSRLNAKSISMELLRELKIDYKEYPSGVSDILETGETTQSLFSLDGYLYTGIDFKRFSLSHFGSKEELFDAFLIKSIMDYEYSRLETKYPEFSYDIQHYYNGLLAEKIIEHEVDRKANDEDGLKAYYKKHKKQYNDGITRFDGIVVHCIDKKVGSQVNRLLKKNHRDQWENLIDLTFNTDMLKVKIDREGLFFLGDNEYVDRIIFRKGGFMPVEGFPVTRVIGKKFKGPSGYDEIRDEVQSGYRNNLESSFVARLWSGSSVEIDEQVLKTVNNH